MPTIILNLLKKLAISLVFDYLFEQFLKFISEKSKQSDNTYDDELVTWIEGYKDEIKTVAKTSLKGG